MPRFDKLLVLDIDETLLLTTDEPLERPHDFEVFSLKVYKRPNVDEFLSTCFEWFKVAIWTSGGSDYARQIAENLSPEHGRLAFVWSSEQCTRIYEPELQAVCYIKNLKRVEKLGFSLEKAIIVDDIAHMASRNYGNLVHIEPWDGSVTDNELMLLLRYLEYLGPKPNVRTIDKRGWRKI